MVTQDILCCGWKHLQNMKIDITKFHGFFVLHKFPLHKICLKKQMFKSVGNDYIYQSDSSSLEVIFPKSDVLLSSLFMAIPLGSTFRFSCKNRSNVYNILIILITILSQVLKGQIQLIGTRKPSKVPQSREVPVVNILYLQRWGRLPGVNTAQ